MKPTLKQGKQRFSLWKNEHTQRVSKANISLVLIRTSVTRSRIALVRTEQIVLTSQCQSLFVESGSRKDCSESRHHTDGFRGSQQEKEGYSEAPGPHTF